MRATPLRYIRSRWDMPFMLLPADKHCADCRVKRKDLVALTGRGNVFGSMTQKAHCNSGSRFSAASFLKIASSQY